MCRRPSKLTGDEIRISLGQIVFDSLLIEFLAYCDRGSVSVSAGVS